MGKSTINGHFLLLFSSPEGNLLIKCSRFIPFISSVVHHFSLQAEGKVGSEVKAARAKAGIALRSLGQ